jgi:ribosomal protein S18 acetylase RimI-like enzyme
MTGRSPGPTGVTVEMLPPDTGADRGLVGLLAGIVNAAYAETEASLWREPHLRIEPRDLAAMIERAAIAAARLSDRIVGCVRVEPIDERTAGFGLLAVDAAVRGAGVGRELVAFAERLARSRGAGTMDCLLLVPREGTHPFKARLDAWYRRLGYRIVGRRAVTEVDPPSEPRLATPCWFVIYRKDLT